jgi:DNA-binding transcriptional ArsR family regulator
VEDRVGRVFAALADPTRRQVVGELRRRETVTATELARELPMTRQAVAKHLAALDEAGLVQGVRSGRETRYRLTPQGVADALGWLADVGAAWDERLSALSAYAERRAR